TKQFSQQASYTSGSTVVTILNTGNDFISFKDSTMRFILTLKQIADGDLPNAATFGGGSVLNLFETIRVITRSGEVLTEINKLNLFNYFKQKIDHTYEWRTEQQGKVMLAADGGTLLPEREFVVPMRMICPLFDDDVLTPANVARGLRIEITLATVATAFKDGGAGNRRVGEYTVSDAELLLDSYKLNGGAMNALNQMAAKDGLVLTYYDVNNSPSTKAAAAASLSSEVRQSVTMANQVWSSLRKTVDVIDRAADSFATREPLPGDSFQYRIGSIYLPQ
ncbi:unnamed protein product, partial [marine sediment metagenome]